MDLARDNRTSFEIPSLEASDVAPWNGVLKPPSRESAAGREHRAARGKRLAESPDSMGEEQD